MRSLGADRVIDYTKEDFAKGGQQYDLIVATAGYRSIHDFKRVLTTNGGYVCTGGAWSQIFQTLLLANMLSEPAGKRLGVLTMKPDFDFATLKELIETDKVRTVIDRNYPLSETGEAFEYYSKRHARGKIVIKVV